MTFTCSWPVLPLPPERHAAQSAQDAPRDAIPVEADPSERVYGRLRGLGTATRTCAAPDCNSRFTARGKRRYCSDRCRTRTAGRAYTARKAERADAEWRAQTEQLRKLHRDEGYLNGS
jgi:hypothetical protein